MDVSQTVKDTENLLRDFIAAVLESVFGRDWPAKCGVTAERVGKWEERRESEKARQEGGAVDPRLIYYADFYDIQTLLKKNWQKFAPALGDLKTMEVYLDELEKLRDPGAHGRELLPHQKQLACGIAGEIRTRLIRYRSKMETSSDCFPRIESAMDSLGSIWTPQGPSGQHCFTEKILRPGDVIDFVLTASDPFGAELKHQMEVGRGTTSWQAENVFTLHILKDHIGKFFEVGLRIRSPRDYHALGDFDDYVGFAYQVLPEKR